jgi:hypothetical protein
MSDNKPKKNKDKKITHENKSGLHKIESNVKIHDDDTKEVSPKTASPSDGENVKLPSISPIKPKTGLPETHEAVPKKSPTKNDLCLVNLHDTKEKETLIRKPIAPLEPIKAPPKPIIASDESSLVSSALHPERLKRKSLEPVDRPVQPISIDIKVTDKKLTHVPYSPLPVAIEPLQNGSVKVLYEMYSEEFEIIEGTLAASCIDDLYCLSDAMPSCHLRLSKYSPQQMRELQGDGELSNVSHQDAEELFLPETLEGVFSNLKVGCEYYCYVQQNSEQLEREKAMHKAQGRGSGERGSKAEGSGEGLDNEDGRGFDSCTCIYGTPCVVS